MISHMLRSVGLERNNSSNNEFPTAI